MMTTDTKLPVVIHQWSWARKNVHVSQTSEILLVQSSVAEYVDYIQRIQGREWTNLIRHTIQSGSSSALEGSCIFGEICENRIHFGKLTH